MNIVLIGMPGSSKTTTGKILAQRLGIPFCDSDEMIVKRVQMEISQYFHAFGEESFRKEESAVIAALAAQNSSVISCGGGVVLKRENIDCLKKSGYIVFLNTAVDTLYQRLLEKKDRPLLEGDLRKKLETLYEKRSTLYNESAHFVIDNTLLTPQETAEKIIDIINKL